ncbi:hypothetical protein [Nakamurella sp.]|uniref:hypothetical protein n=1 Tax=Nakamurella sp. TaxID=1869182 RepID=UPI0037844AED
MHGEVWGLDLALIETGLTLAEVTPAMAELRQPPATCTPSRTRPPGADRSVGVPRRGETPSRPDRRRERCG